MAEVTITYYPGWTSPAVDYVAATCDVKFHYDPDVVHIIKATVPSRSRGFSSNSKRWDIDPSYADKLEAELRLRGHTVVRSTGETGR